MSKKAISAKLDEDLLEEVGRLKKSEMERVGHRLRQVLDLPLKDSCGLRSGFAVLNGGSIYCFLRYSTPVSVEGNASSRSS